MQTPKAGWAETEITPPLGLPMGGRGPRFAPGAVVLDPLLAQALALEDSGGNRTLWLSLDHDSISDEASAWLRYNLAALAGIPPEAVIINCSHTHSGPMGNFSMQATSLPKPEALGAYEQERDQQILRLGCKAIDNLQPVRVAWYRGRSNIGINRRQRNEAGEIVMAPNPEGRYNAGLWVLELNAVKGPDRCLLFSYGCHPVVVYGFNWAGISADYPGLCRRRLKEIVGPAVHCQFMQGLAGDVRPRALAGLDTGLFRPSTAADLEKIGAQLALDVVDTLAGPGESLDLAIAARSGWFLAKRDPNRLPPLSYWQTLAGRENELDRNVGSYWLQRLQSDLPLARALPWEIGWVRLAPEHFIAWFSGEPVAEWLGHLRNWLPKSVVAWGCCQDTSGYLPTDEQLPEGGYEVVESAHLIKTGPGPFAAGLNEIVRQSFLNLARSI